MQVSAVRTPKGLDVSTLLINSVIVLLIKNRKINSGFELNLHIGYLEDSQ